MPIFHRHLRFVRHSSLLTACTLAIIVSQHPALAQNEFAAAFSPDRDETTPTSWNVSSADQTSVRDQDSDWQMTRYDFRLSTPVWSNERTAVDLHGRFTLLDMETRALLPESFFEKLPDSLWDVRLGGTFRHKLDNGWTAGGGLTLGSASDHPFASADESVLQASAFVRVPVDERDSWLFLLYTSNTWDLEPFVPLPGIGYSFKRGDLFEGTIGAPYTSLQYRPIDRLTLEASYLMPRTVHARAGYRLFEPLELFATFDWDNQSFFRHDRSHRDHRLVYDEKRVMGGIDWRLGENVNLTLAAGYAFDRFFFEGEDYDDRGRNRINFADGALATVRLSVSF
ncbi:MAG: hypothetical protein HOP29_16710 [Phycisphaerales bacterium]|nr:hypothetical protein [Phycisphaerales bacterium]